MTSAIPSSSNEQIRQQIQAAIRARGGGYGTVCCHLCKRQIMKQSARFAFRFWYCDRPALKKSCRKPTPKASDAAPVHGEG